MPLLLPFFTIIANAIDIVVETVVATVIATVIATALDIVVVAIVEPRVRFPDGTSNVCLTHWQCLYSAPDALLYAQIQVYAVSLPLSVPIPL